jgi:hypothetical protein
MPTKQPSRSRSPAAAGGRRGRASRASPSPAATKQRGAELTRSGSKLDDLVRTISDSLSETLSPVDQQLDKVEAAAAGLVRAGSREVVRAAASGEDLVRSTSTELVRMLSPRHMQARLLAALQYQLMLLFMGMAFALVAPYYSVKAIILIATWPAAFATAVDQKMRDSYFAVARWLLVGMLALAPYIGPARILSVMPGLAKMMASIGHKGLSKVVSLWCAECVSESTIGWLGCGAVALLCLFPSGRRLIGRFVLVPVYCAINEGLYADSRSLFGGLAALSYAALTMDPASAAVCAAGSLFLIGAPIAYASGLVKAAGAIGMVLWWHFAFYTLPQMEQSLVTSIPILGSDDEFVLQMLSAPSPIFDSWKYIDNVRSARLPPDSRDLLLRSVLGTSLANVRSVFSVDQHVLPDWVGPDHASPSSFQSSGGTAAGRL